MKASCVTTDLNKHSDSALVVAAKHGDMQAFEELVVRHQRRAFAIAQRITRNREDAEEVVQDTFHKVFLHLGKFEEKSRFSTWLTRIAMNEAFMLLRRRRGGVEVLPENSDDSMKSNSEAFIDHSPNPEESYLRRERTEILTGAINRLGSTVRTTILLRDIEERSVRETAQILGTSITAVKARVFQGRRKLRNFVHRELLRGVCENVRVEAQHC